MSTTIGDAWIRTLSTRQLREALSMADAVDALEAGLRAELPVAPPRGVLPGSAGGELLVMPAIGRAAAGVKVLGVQPANRGCGLPLIQGAFVLFDAQTLTPRLVIDGAELTRLRTSALSGLATRHLARADAATLVIFGAGAQARAHVEAMRAVRPIARVLVVAPRRAAAAELAESLAAEGLDASAGRREDVRDADIVCTCTTASEPLFDGDELAPGAHVNAIGAYQPDARELDARTLQRATVVVDDRAAVLEKAGDLLVPIGEGAYAAERIAGDLRAVAGGALRRSSASEITVYKSVGVAYQDLIVAEAAARRLS